MRRRALLAASQTGGGGGEFYVDLYGYHPLFGEQFYRTATFVIDGEKTWEEAAGLKDIKERFEITTFPKPSGGIIVFIQAASEDEMANTYSAVDDLDGSDKIIIGHTYKFISE